MHTQPQQPLEKGYKPTPPHDDTRDVVRLIFLRSIAVIAAVSVIGTLARVVGVFSNPEHTVGSIHLHTAGSNGDVREPSPEEVQPAVERSDAAAAPSDPRSSAETEVGPGGHISSLPRPVEDPALSEFDGWVNDYLAAASFEERSALEGTGSALVARRSEALMNLIQIDPARSLHWAVPLTIRRRLPPSVTEQLEEVVEGNADLAVIGVLACSGDAVPQSTIKRSATVNGRTYRAFVYGRRLQLSTQTNLPIHGIAVGNVLAMHEDPVRVLEDEEAADPALPAGNADGRCPVSGAAVNPIVAVQVGGQVFRLCCGEHAQAFNRSLCAQEEAAILAKSRIGKTDGRSGWTKGVKTVLFMRVTFSDRAQEPIAVAEADHLMDQVNNFFQKASFGLTSLQTTVTTVLALPSSVSKYTTDEMALLGDARQAAAAAGYDADSYDLDCACCGRALGFNQALIGGKGAWLSYADLRVACHEFGHNFGLHHANAWVTSDGTTIGTGTNQEYGNFFDTMGSSPAGEPFNAFEKRLLDWLPESMVTTVRSNGVYRLCPVDTPTLASGGTYALRIPKDSQRDYWIEMRQSHAETQLDKGILLTWSPWDQSNGGNQLLNCNPQSTRLPALQVGQVFYDLDRGLRITPLDFIHIVPSAVDVQVHQVDFIPIELTWPQSPRSTSSGANSDSLQGHLASAEAVDFTAFSCEVTIPQADPYVIWVQTLGASPPSDSTSVSVLNENGVLGTVLLPAPAAALSWRILQIPAASPSIDLGAKTFSFSKGDHTIQVRAKGAQPQAVRLLITNDPATNLPPVISNVPGQTLAADSSVTIPFFISAIGQPASSLAVRASCEDPALGPDSNLVLEGEGFDRTLTVLSTPDRAGTSRIKLTVVDGLGRLARQSFPLTVIGIIQGRISHAASGTRVMLPAGTNYDNLFIDKDLTLEGWGVNQTVIDGQNKAVTVTISSNCTVTLRNMTIVNGRGAGLRNFGTLNLMSSVVRQNRGTGIDNRGALVMVQDIVENNQAAEGGGLDNRRWATLLNCSISGNVVNGGAGGIMNRKAGRLTCEDCCIASNRALQGNGGGLQNFGELTLRNCTISGNDSTDQRPGEIATGRVTGGAIFNSGRLTLQSTTVFRNQSDWEGGGLDNRAEADLANSIIAGNASRKTRAADCSGTLTSIGHNLIQDPTGCTIQGNLTGNILGQDPRLGTLGDHGGLTKTVELLPGSPAIDAGDGTVSPGTDQRGIGRPTGLGVDMGAFEFQPSSLVFRQLSGATRVRFYLQPGRRYTVEASSDCVDWVTVRDHTTGLTGVLEFVDADAAKFPIRFYRARFAEG